MAPAMLEVNTKENLNKANTLVKEVSLSKMAVAVLGNSIMTNTVDRDF
jgi:hypothetical protein